MNKGGFIPLLLLSLAQLKQRLTNARINTLNHDDMDVTVSRVEQLKAPGNEIVVRLHFNEIEESLTLTEPLSQAYLSDPLPEHLKTLKDVKIVQWNKDKVLLKKVHLFGIRGQYVPFVCDNES